MRFPATFRRTLPILLGFLSAVTALGTAILGLFRFADGAAAQVTIDTSLGQTFGLGTADLQQTIINVVQWALGLLALVGVVMIIYGGIVWMTSAGNEQRIEKAKRIIRDAIIGTVIVLLAWAIVIFFIRGITGATGPGGGGGPVTCGAAGVCSATACGFRCDGTNWVADATCNAAPPCSTSDFRVIWRSPAANAVNVPQCRIIQARFSEDVDGGTVNNTTFIVRDQPTMTTVSGTYNIAGAIVSFRPDADLAQNTVYEVEVTAGLKAVSTLSANPETWIFTTGALTDTDPPSVTAVSPPVGSVDICRQTKVQTIFSEEMDVTTIYGDRTCTMPLVCPPGPGCPCTDTVTQRTCNVPGGGQTCTILGTVRLRNNTSGTDLGLKNNFSFPDATSFSAKQVLPPLDANTPHSVVESARDDAAFYYAGIRDACGNPLDGDNDGTAENGDGDFGTADDDYEWSFTTGIVEQCIPAITNVDFGNGVYSDDPGGPAGADTRVTMDGENFDLVGNVIFNRNVYNNGTCFNPPDHRIDTVGSCVLSWTPTRIIARVPTDSYSSVPGGNPIIVDAGGDLAVSPTPFDVQSPRISVLDPNNGNTNDFITIAGLHLGAGPGTVWFRTPGNQLAGLQPPAICGPSWWADTQIVIKVPDLTTIGVAYNTWLTVQVERADGQWSDAQPFKFVDGPPRPGICNGSLCGVTGGVPVQLVGQNFENGPPVPPSINHSVAIGATSPQAYAGWNNTQIDFTTVNTLPNGTHTIKVHTPAGWSNAWAYTVPCGAAPGVYETTQCIPAGAQPSPFPQKSRADACRNTGIRLEYNTDMNNFTILNPANYEIERCNVGGSFDAVACTVVVPITGVPLILMGDPSLNAPNHEGVRLNYAGLLDADTWYRVTVSNQVSAQSGARMTNDYVWAFRTKAGDACPVTDIWLNGPAAGPPDYLTQPPDWEDYDASVGNAATCDVFNPWLYTYTWDLVYNTGAVTLSNLLNPWEQRGNSAAPGSDRIRVTSEGRSANRRIIVDYCMTDLDCQDYDDDGSNGDPLDCDASLCDDTTKRCTPAFKNAAAFTPASGTMDNWVTVQGCWFGGGPGSLTFMAGPQNATFPDVALCGDTWQDDEIVAVVPAVGLNGPIRVQRSDGVSATTAANWAEDGIVRPGMCRLVPESGTYFSSTTAWGHLFGDPRPPGSDLIFTPNAPAAQVTQWIDTRVTGTVPTNAVTGNAAVNNGTQTSNPRLYTVVPAARPTVTATVPADAATDICPNAQIKVTFSMNMKADSIVNPADATNHPNVILQEANCGTHVPFGPVLPSRVGAFRKEYTIQPSAVLAKDRCYAVTTVGDPDTTDGTETGVMSLGGLAMAGDHRFWFRTMGDPAVPGVCAIDHYDLAIVGSTSGSFGTTPYTFLCSQDGCDPADVDAATPGNQRLIYTIAYDRNNQVLNHQHTLTKTNTPNNILDVFAPGSFLIDRFLSYFGVIQDVGSGTEYMDVLIDGDDFTNPDGTVNANSLQSRVTIHLDRCELPWPEQPATTAFTPFQDILGTPRPAATAATNFSTWYCRDGGVTLPEIDNVAEIIPPPPAGACATDTDCPLGYQCEAGGTCRSNLLKQFLFTFDDKPNDVIGIQVRKNPEHLSPGAWYDRYVPSENQGSPSSMTLAGYPAVREGRSIYVAGVNLVNGAPDDVYSNIYLLSYASDTPDELCTTLAYNGSFEVDDGTDFDPNNPGENATAGDSRPDGWVPSGGISLNAAEFVEGSQSVSIVSPGAQSYVISDLALPTGKRYVVTGYFKHTGTGSGGIGLQRAHCVAGGPAAACVGLHAVNFADNDLSQVVTGDSGGWVQVRYEFTFNNPNLFVRVGCFADLSGGNAGDTTLCDNIRVVSEDEEQCAVDISPAKEIYDRMTQKFALNLNETQIDGGVVGLERLQRDHIRLNDLKGIAADLVNYQTLHGSYPPLGAGTYLPQMSTSLWPSWAETLGDALGSGDMPSDPRQSENASQLRCADPFEPATCWNEESKIFQCPTDIGNPFAAGTFAYWNYGYQTDPDGANAKLLGRFEYTARWVNPVAGTTDSVQRSPVVQQCGGYPGSTCACYSHELPLP